MTVSLGNGVDIGNIVTAETNPLTGEIELSAAVSELPGRSPSDVDIMFMRPSGKKTKFTVPSPYLAIGDYVIHPSIVHIPTGWNGYKYWMAYTPLPLNNSAYENPCICAANDLNGPWVVPLGCPNPIDVSSNPGVVYNRDTHLYFTGSELVMMYNTKGEDLKNKLKVVTSPNGSVWSAPVVIWEGGANTSDMASPSFWHDPVAGLWVCVGHNVVDAGNAFRRITSPSLLSGWETAPTVLTFTPATGRKWWHSWFTRLSSGRIIGIAMDNNGNIGDSGYNYACQSIDGATYEAAVIQNDTSTAKPGGIYYRATACFVERNGVVEGYVIYSFTNSGVFISQKLANLVQPSLISEYQKIANACAMAKIASTKGVLAADDFNRADSATGLGVTLDGKTWTQVSGVDLVGIAGGMTYPVTTGNCVALLDVGKVNYSISAVLGAVGGAGASGYLVLNREDATHFWRIGQSGGQLLIQRYNGTLDINPYLLDIVAVKNGDILRADVSGKSAKFYLNGELMYSTDGGLFENVTTVGVQASGATHTKFDAFAVEFF